MPAVVLGDRGSGKTTFLGLLYTAALRYGTEREDRFRLHVPSESLRGIDRVHRELAAGQFPSQTAREELGNLRFEFAYRRRGLAGIFSAARGQEPFTVLPILAPRGPDSPGQDGVARYLDGALHHRLALLLVDAGAATAPPDTAEEAARNAWDRRLAKFLEDGAALHRERGVPAQRVVAVLTKADRLDSRALAAHGVPEEVPPPNDTRSRRRWGEALLRAMFPEMWKHLGPTAPPLLLSRVGTREGERGVEIVRIARDLGGWEPDYPYPEFEALIEILGTLA